MTSLTDDAYVGTLHYKALDPPVSGTAQDLQDVCDQGNITTTAINCGGINSTGLIQTAGAVNIYSDGDLIANGNVEGTKLTATTGDIEATTGDITALAGDVDGLKIIGKSTAASPFTDMSIQGVNAYLSGGITLDPTTGGDFRAEGSSSDCIVGQDLQAGRNLLVGTGATGGNISCEGEIRSVNGNLQLDNGSVNVDVGNITATAGNMTCGNQLTVNGLCSFGGNLQMTSPSGGISTTGGNITAGGSGFVIAGGNIQANRDMNATTLTINNVDKGSPPTSLSAPLNPNTAPVGSFDITNKSRASYWLWNNTTQFDLNVETGIPLVTENCGIWVSFGSSAPPVTAAPYVVSHIVSPGSSSTQFIVRINTSAAPVFATPIKIEILFMRD